MDRAGGFRRDVAGDAVGPGKLPEQPLHAVAVTLDVGIALGVGAFEVALRDRAGAAVPRPHDVDHVQVVLDDQPVQVDVDEVQTGGRAPVPQKAGLDVFAAQGLVEQRIVLQVDLPDRKIVRSTPVGVHLLEKFRGKGMDRRRVRACRHGGLGVAKRSWLFALRPVGLGHGVPQMLGARTGAAAPRQNGVTDRSIPSSNDVARARLMYVNRRRRT